VENFKTFLRKELMDEPEVPDGMRWCPQCKKFYKPRYPSKEEAMKTKDAEGREQWISGICSTKCWKKTMKE